MSNRLSIAILLLAVVLFFNFYISDESPKQWLKRAKNTADSIICARFKIATVESAFTFNMSKSSYEDTTLIDRSLSKKFKEKVNKWQKYKDGINYVPSFYVFVYNLKNVNTRDGYEIYFALDNNLKIVESQSEVLFQPFKIYDVNSLPSKREINHLIKKYGFNIKNCYAYYVELADKANDGQFEIELALDQVIGRVAPHAKDASCDSSEITKSIRINPWTKELKMITIDIMALCI